MALRAMAARPGKQLLQPEVTLLAQEKNHTSCHILKIPVCSFHNFVHAKFSQHCIMHNNFILTKENVQKALYFAHIICHTYNGIHRHSQI